MMDPASLRKLLRQLSVWNAPGATCLTWEHVQIHIRDTGINAHAHNFARISLRSWLQLLSCWLPLMECNGSRCSKQPIAVLWDGYDIFISYIIYIYIRWFFYINRVLQRSNWHLSNFKLFMWLPTWTRLQSGSYDAMELFSGVATLSRCWREAGYPTCNLDIRDWNPWAEARAAAGLPTSNGNPLDLTTPSGFGFLSFKLYNFMS
jgi:hypothetical protein